VKAHLGVIQVGHKVAWTDQHGAHRGRVLEVVRAADGVCWTRLDLLPYTARRKLVLVPLHQLERLPNPARR
jgi:hypothetical protein